MTGQKYSSRDLEEAGQQRSNYTLQRKREEKFQEPREYRQKKLITSLTI
jgi:hypothetical protein